MAAPGCSLKQVGVFPLDRLAALEGLSGFVGVFRIGHPEGTTTLTSAALNALVNASAVAQDRLFIGRVIRRGLGCGRNRRDGRVCCAGPVGEICATMASTAASDRPAGMVNQNGRSCLFMSDSPGLSRNLDCMRK